MVKTTSGLYVTKNPTLALINVQIKKSYPSSSSVLEYHSLTTTCILPSTTIHYDMK